MSNFTLNRYWTYPDSRSRHFLHQLGMFFLVNAAGIAFRIPILALCRAGHGVGVRKDGTPYSQYRGSFLQKTQLWRSPSELS